MTPARQPPGLAGSIGEVADRYAAHDPRLDRID
jgi:hypothetical protein